MLSLVRDDVEVGRPRPAAPRVIPVTMLPLRARRHRPRGALLALRALRAGIMMGSLTAAWQIGLILGHL